MTTEDQRAALDAEGIAAMAAAGIPRDFISAWPPAASVSSLLGANVRGHAVQLYAAGPEGAAFWFAAASKPGAAEDICHRADTAARALKHVLRRIPGPAKRPNEPWPNAAEVITGARAALAAAGLDTTRATDHPSALLGAAVALRVEVGDGHAVVTLGRRGCVEPAQWGAGLKAWAPGRGTQGTPALHAERMPTATAALAASLVWALGQDWPTEAEREAMHGMLARLRAVEAVS
jgi:hypothetical protein